ncbi:MAG: DNA-binding protein [Gammaproteobacteria bacterium]|nr:DNA-binding protein [Gammaproteobacteria bacterium]NIR96681.1 DNA-binding protein [Gammaproteobacteria bacterium]NIT62385.1 DNA-binding protein [Gammaproteobacteria bacterium]NIV19317.1 DNA-binding protein [Gammaproteobacteria bacterium]NIY30965.1 DNA-binding protein [Gammaproteobacteria bacterium]
MDPRRLAREGRQLAGRLPLASMQRLGPYLHGTEGEVEVELAFGIDVVGITYVRGSARARVELVCQRCLEPMAAELEAQFALGVVASEREGEQLPETYEPLVAGDEPIQLAGVIEDELILAMPIIARHRLEECPASERASASVSGPEAGADSHPFAILKKLKTKH